MAKSMNPDLSGAVEQLGSVTGMNFDQAQTWLANHASAQIERAHEMTRRKLIGSKRGPRRHSSAPRASRKRQTAGAGASE